MRYHIQTDISTIDHTCNFRFEMWWVHEAISLSKNFAKHGLVWEAPLRHKPERSSVLYVRHISSDLSQCQQSTGQVEGWLVS